MLLFEEKRKILKLICFQRVVIFSLYFNSQSVDQEVSGRRESGMMLFFISVILFGFHFLFGFCLNVCKLKSRYDLLPTLTEFYFG